MTAEETGDDLRPLLFSIAYRMLGTASDAEDIVQEAYLRLHQSEAEGVVVRSDKAFLTTIATRLAIDQLRSARVRRETYYGPWLPEPLLTSPDPDGAALAEQADSLSFTFLVLLERLSPLERAVFLLREVFDYGYDEIADIVEKSEANCRQVFSRARKHVDAGQARFEVSGPRQEQLTGSFLAAVQTGEVERLIGYLAEDVVFYGDGGGKGRGLPKPVFGAGNVARLLVGFFEGYRSIDARMQLAQINGQPGVLAFDSENRLINVLAFDIVGDVFRNVRSVINPDKLGHLGYPLSPIALSDSSPTSR
ncbi:MAG TPA: RNA polymerase sigma-70 factor [Gaiellaceae bacterium]|nr:RNA polymerase sigma-70 factor [Gaiellaceae bacterium]